MALRIDERAVRRVAQGWLLVVALGLMALAFLSAHVPPRAVAAHRKVPGVNDIRPVKYEADGDFPGAALLRAGTVIAASGTTGTASLPALPVPASVAEALVRAEPMGIVPALPFAALRVGAVDRGRALECLTAAIYYEAGAEPDAGQQAVAQVVLNRVRHPAFPATVCGVVYQGSGKTGCQFSFACDGAMRRVPSAAGWARAGRVAGAALAGRVYAPVGLATHYHTYAVTPVWNRALVMTDMVGAHLFHRWKGYWGTAAAFRQRYVGVEPVPGPHVPIATLVDTLNRTAPVQTLTDSGANNTAVVSIYGVNTTAPVPTQASDDTAVVRTPGAKDKLPPASAVLAKWKDARTLR